MNYVVRTVKIRWEEASVELGILDCPQGTGAEADQSFLTEAVRQVKPCFEAFSAPMAPQAKFLLVVRALVQTYRENGRDQRLENALATFFMQTNWQTWCQMMDPDGRLGPPPPPPGKN